MFAHCIIPILLAGLQSTLTVVILFLYTLKKLTILFIYAFKILNEFYDSISLSITWARYVKIPQYGEFAFVSLWFHQFLFSVFCGYIIRCYTISELSSW